LVRRIGIIGMGAVGAAMARIFPNATTFDEPKATGSRSEINECDVAFVCVPTPARPDGSCDTSIVEGVMEWVDGPIIVLRSTVSVGTTRRLSKQYHKPVVFQPEYGPAETPDHPFNDLRKIRWLIFGGERAHCRVAASAWKTVYSSDVTMTFTTPETAELCKYMENAFLATKVTFCNEFFDIADRLGVDYDELREVWLLDPRIGRTHTFVYPDNRGFGGKCLPKDLAALIACASDTGYEPSLLVAVQQANQRFRSTSSKGRRVPASNRSG
jgi:UDPglucose 6-dehydrogenase